MKNLFLLSLVLAGAAHAQTFKCTLPGGKVEYRGSPCEGSSQAAPMTRGSISGVDAMPANEIRRANGEAAPAAPRVSTAGGGKPVPSERDIKNMETSASSITLSKREKLVREAEIKAAKDLRAGGSGKIDMSAVQAEDARVEARRAAAAKPVAVPGTPTNMANCDGAGCWGWDGKRYTNGGAGTYFRNDGKACRKAGDQLLCD